MTKGVKEVPGFRKPDKGFKKDKPSLGAYKRDEGKKK